MLPNQVSSSMTVFCSNSLASSLCIVQNFPCAQFLSCKNRYGITYYTLKSTKSTNHPTNQPATLLTLFWFEQYHIHDTHYYYIETTRTLQDNLDVETTPLDTSVIVYRDWAIHYYIFYGTSHSHSYSPLPQKTFIRFILSIRFDSFIHSVQLIPHSIPTTKVNRVRLWDYKKG